jgi:hypothetical protein
MSHDRTDVASLHEHFPPGIAVPPLLVAFAEWLSGAGEPGLGDFDAIAGERFEYWVSDDDATDELRPKLAQFLLLPDGSRVALWDHGQPVPAVVLIGSEGDLENLAPSLEAFLQNWTRGNTGVLDLDFGDAPEPDADDDGERATRSALAAWLEARGVSAPDVPEPPDFQHWLEGIVAASVRARAERAAARPALVVPARPPVDLVARVEVLLGRRTDDPAVAALCVELGFDLSLVPGPDEFRALARLDQGYCLELIWPWEHERDRTFSRAERDALERQRVRVLAAIQLHAEGDRAAKRALGDAYFSAFGGALPHDLHFADTHDAVVAKLGAPERDHASYSGWYDAAARRALGVSFSTDDYTRVPVGRVRYIDVRQR